MEQIEKITEKESEVIVKGLTLLYEDEFKDYHRKVDFINDASNAGLINMPKYRTEMDKVRLEWCKKRDMIDALTQYFEKINK